MSSTRWSRPACWQIRLHPSAMLTTSLGRPSNRSRSPDTLVIESQDATACDVVGEDPADRKSQVPIQPLAKR